jgi:tRNA (guanine37-N1)-methyltransferase
MRSPDHDERNTSVSTEDMFHPPVNRAMKVLDRSFFQKTIPTSAARIFDSKTTSKCRTELIASREILPSNRVYNIRPDPDSERAQKGGKCMVLRPEVVHNGESSSACDAMRHWPC